MVREKLILSLMGLSIIFIFLLSEVFLNRYEGLTVSKIFIFKNF